MRKSEKEITDKKLIEEILSKSAICRIAMMDQEEPYIVPLNYGYSDNRIYFHSAPEGRKIELLKRNNRVCFEIEYAAEIIRAGISCKWTTKYRSVIGYGRVEIVTDTEGKKNGLDIIMSKYGESGIHTYNEASFEKMVLLVLHIDTVSGKQSGIWS